uniref:Uncharacterized protein n=1 Tax=Candidatus Kentrum sp. UNK TaxID=2126344 RepID=A0A451AUJ7_9GAMM|nr:MAG: hypothetical protein BECKUNK1418G_GA0071005_100158 [Candidatus Kentron sp. UNK]VFK69726.1 MAG: hypothetical protein BECKUNK1418H_GA0071006_101825 [Candidatus Kentron sp. UNK]
MTLDYYFVIGIVCGVTGIGTLVWISLYHARTKPGLAEGMIVFLTSASLVAGIKVCVLTLNPTVLTEVENERIYVFLGGLGVIWVSIDTIWTTLLSVYRKKGDPTGDGG